jgi:hypothetical protein
MKAKIEYLNTQFFCMPTKRYVTIGENDLICEGRTTPKATKEEIEWFLKNGYEAYFEDKKENKSLKEVKEV